MLTQIYQANSNDEAVLLSEAGVDLIGLVVNIQSDFPGILDIKEATAVMAGISKSSKSVILPFTDNIQTIQMIIRLLNPDVVHIAAEPQRVTPQDLALLKEQFSNKEFMRTIPVTDESSIELAKQYEGYADYLLLDTKIKDQIGVTGLAHDWQISRRIVEEVSIPVILAGGIGVENVQEAISVVHPFGVDSKTKTDLTGSNLKDIRKVREFVRLAKNFGDKL